MTREERELAIEELRGCIIAEEHGKDGKPNGNVTCELTKDTIDMAIKALEQEPCECKSEDNLCDTCDNKACIFQSGIKRSKCDFYTLHLEPDNCGNYIVQMPNEVKNDLPHCQYTDEEIAKSFIEDVEAVKDQLPTKNNLGVDCVSRQAISGYIDYILSHGMGKKKSFDYIKKFVANLPSVTPQEPCDKCEVGNPCLYCKHEFEPQKSEEVYAESNN